MHIAANAPSHVTATVGGPAIVAGPDATPPPPPDSLLGNPHRLASPHRPPPGRPSKTMTGMFPCGPRRCV